MEKIENKVKEIKSTMLNLDLSSLQLDDILKYIKIINEIIKVETGIMVKKELDSNPLYSEDK